MLVACLSRWCTNTEEHRAVISSVFHLPDRCVALNAATVFHQVFVLSQNGELGHGERFSHAVPKLVEALCEPPVVLTAVACGSFHTIALSGTTVLGCDANYCDVMRSCTMS